MSILLEFAILSRSVHFHLVPIQAEHNIATSYQYGVGGTLRDEYVAFRDVNFFLELCELA